MPSDDPGELPLGELPLGELPLGELLARCAARTPAPGGGSAAALACSLAAALVEMATAYEAGPEAPQPARSARAARLRARGLELAQSDLHSYEPVLAALALEPADPARPARVSSALACAATVPLQIAELGAEIAELGADAAQRASRHLVGDAVAGVVLAEGACRTAAHLVALNVAGSSADARLAAAAAESARRSAAARDRALAQGIDV